MTQPPNYPGDNQGGFPPPQDPQQPGGQPGQGFPPPPQQPAPGFPPPQGAQGFPPPQPGQGYPPPPAGGYPPVQGGYGAPYGGGPQHFNLGDAFSWAWNKFTKNAAALIVPIVVYFIALAAITAVGVALIAALGVDSETTDDAGNVTATLTTGGTVSSAILMLLIGIVAYIAQAAYVTGLLDITDGKQVSIGSFFSPRNAGQVVVAALILGVVNALLSLIPYVGSILSVVVGFLALFAIPAIVDRNLSAIDGFKQGFAVIQRDVGNSILVFVIAALVAAVGTALCLVGALVAVPVASLLIVNAYRSISGGNVAPLTP
ncbi:hypothetical protein [Tsukamurella strandjordii]|uniref:Integral membrane protein n=1 Tax=Tsukamurella strandjordii TaxID=147577 RepID=A0AA90N954_9ACTN|nr:hypothetical protein [Tsukamurella strandjordii]MDP0397936.1 hypothetical protein [Tsukamurella strandjordii]